MFKRLGMPLALLLGMLLLIGWLISQPFWQSLQRVAVAMRLIHQEYVDADAVDYDLLAGEAIRGMADSLDAYSAYLDSAEYNHFSEITRQEYIGVGIEIEQIRNGVVVIDVFAGGPAAEAGIRAGDRIISVDGQSTRDADVEKVSSMLRGPLKESVAIGIERPGTEDRVFDVVRGPVHIDTVETEPLGDDKIGYIRISQFGESTPQEFSRARINLEEADMRGLILDLRNNPGGLLTASRDVAAEFFSKDALVVYTQGRDAGQRREYVSLSGRRAGDYPVVVLINENSASGAEIVAGALQDAGVAYVVGERSRGKGSVQSIYGFRDGDGLRQTTALYYLPSGRSINESGVVPDLIVEVSEEEELQLILQERHMDYMDAESFENLFDSKPDLEDRQRDAASDYIEDVLRATKRRV